MSVIIPFVIVLSVIILFIIILLPTHDRKEWAQAH